MARPPSGGYSGVRLTTATSRQFNCRSVNRTLYAGAPDRDGDAERDARSAAQWFDAIIAYLEFRAGAGWRRSPDRRSARYYEYLDAIRLLNERRYQDDAPCNCSAHCLPQRGFRRQLAVAPPPPYPGDEFFRFHPELDALTDSSGRYVGFRRRLPRWIDRPEVHFVGCMCARHRLAHHAAISRRMAVSA